MALYLVRHGSAGVRNDHDPHDDDRRLDATGRLQSERLSEWLVHEAPTVLRSSPYLRCRQTLEPLATALGIDVVVDDRLAEGTPVEASWSLLEELSECSAVLCSHGDVIPDLVGRAQRRGMVVPGRSGCSKGSVWALRHWDGETFATGLYTPVKA